ncbi:MAG TPA: hypothetical protein VGE83_08575 [Terracidiphilus sp.]
MQSTPAKVIEYLNIKKIGHSEYARDAKEGNLIRAFVRDKSKWDLVRTDVAIEFRFDDHDQLVSYEVREHFTGP